jgi:hypothetical protein
VGRSSRYLIAALCAVLILVACTAGCTSSTTSSPSPASESGQTSAAAKTGQSGTAGYPADNAGSDPDPSVVPRYQPSVRLLSPDKNGTGWAFETKDPLSSVKAFYSAQMTKLGYSVSGTENSTQTFWSVNYAKGNTTILIHAGSSSPSPIWDGYLPPLTNVTNFSFAKISPGQDGP